MLLKAVCNNSKKLLSFLLAVIVFAGCMVLPTNAEEIDKDEIKSEIEELQQQIQQNQAEIDRLNAEAALYDDDINLLQSKIDALQEQIDLYNKEIALIDADIAQINAQILSIEQEISALNSQVTLLEKQILKLQDEKAEIYVLLGERIRASYMSGPNTALEFLLTSDDFEFLSYLERVELLARVAENDEQLINKLEENIAQIDVKLIEIEDAKKRLNFKIGELDAAKAEHEAKKQEQVDARRVVEDAEAEIQADLDKVMAIVNALDAQSAEYQAAIDSREEAISDLEDKLASENKHYGSGVTGDMIWPLPYEDAYISSSFKMRTLNGVTKQHNGIDTCRRSGTMGADVIAVKAGTVEVANWGWGGGYGNYVVINHGEGVLTYYAHLSNVRVSVGQTVTQGDVIGNAGNTGYSFGAHLHFGLMINGGWVNPCDYLTRSTPGGSYIYADDGY